MLWQASMNTSIQAGFVVFEADQTAAAAYLLSLFELVGAIMAVVGLYRSGPADVS
jgi:hypothetical protein